MSADLQQFLKRFLGQTPDRGYANAYYNITPCVRNYSAARVSVRQAQPGRFGLYRPGGLVYLQT